MAAYYEPWKGGKDGGGMAAYYEMERRQVGMVEWQHVMSGQKVTRMGGGMAAMMSGGKAARMGGGMAAYVF